MAGKRKLGPKKNRGCGGKNYALQELPRHRRRKAAPRPGEGGGVGGRLEAASSRSGDPHKDGQAGPTRAEIRRRPDGAQCAGRDRRHRPCARPHAQDGARGRPACCGCSCAGRRNSTSVRHQGSAACTRASARACPRRGRDGSSKRGACCSARSAAPAPAPLAYRDGSSKRGACSAPRRPGTPCRIRSTRPPSRPERPEGT